MSPYENLFKVPRPPEPPPRPAASVTVLPLNLLALIISHIDNVADLARVCQTSRVLHYMTLPQLYKNITLSSYERIRYKDDHAEGIGSASPFSMGLNALVTRNVCTLVRTLALQGHWREHDLEEYSRAGRVPDDSMMLNIAVRAAVDRCTLLESFKWDLNTKLLPTVYTGLAPLKHLRSFHLRFPSSRSPRPTVEIPPMPHLRSFTMTHYDPLCYPDDISALLFHATKLHTLKMHFAPRMRDHAEPSVQMLTFFRKNIAAKRQLKLRTVQFYNLFALSHRDEIAEAVDGSKIEHVTFLNTFGLDEGNGQIVNPDEGFLSFFDRSWINPPQPIVMQKSQRHDRLSRKHAQMLASITGLEALYLVNARHKKSTSPNPNGSTHPGPSPPSSNSTPSVNGTPHPSSSRSNSTNNNSPTFLRDTYLDAICHHGPTLRHLLLPARWPLPTSVLARLFRACPNLTQLALAMESNGFVGMSLLVPFLSKLTAIRVLVPCCDGNGNGADGDVGPDELAIEDTHHEERMARKLALDGGYEELRYVGMGAKSWVIGGVYESVEMVKDDDGEGEEREEVVLRRRVRRAEPSEVAEVEIWRMDSLDVV